MPKGNTKTGVDPCLFLSDAQAAQLGSKPGKISVDDRTLSGCDFDGPPFFGIAYYSDRPYRQRVVDAKPVDIGGGRAALLGTSAIRAGCSVSIEVTSSTSVVTNSSDTDLSYAKQCTVAKLVAQAIEPNLPQG